MATKTSTTKSKRVSVSKKKLAETAEGMEVGAEMMAVSGVVGVAAGMETLEDTRKMVRAGAEELASGASDLTRAADTAFVAERVARLSDVVGEAGMVDMAQGVALLAHSEDVKVLSDMVGLMSADDMEDGLAMA